VSVGSKRSGAPQIPCGGTGSSRLDGSYWNQY